MDQNKIKKNIMAIGTLAAIPILSGTNIAMADGGLEAEFNSIVNKYNQEDIVVENGISLKTDETLDLSQYPGWEMSNDSTVTIDENGIVKPIKEGTVYLSNEISDKVHIIEIYVSSNSTKLKSIATTATVNRDYYKVFIDPGHGGSDNGASGFGLLEDELNLQISKSVESKLKQRGIEVMMSRTSDTYLSLSQRAQMANSYEADVFVSIHQNSASTESANGIETYYHKDKNDYRPYSIEIQNNAIKETSARDRGVKSANFAVVRETTMPSSLFESGFISNKAEGQKLSDPVYQDKLASAIANGIENYLKENIKLNQGETTNPSEPTPPVNPPISPDEPEIPEITPPSVEIIKRGTVTASSLNVRSGYGTSYSKIGSISKGSNVEIVETKGSWYKIKYNSGFGFVSADYISISTTVPPKPENPNPPEVTPPTNVIQTGVVTASSLNVRSGYGTSYSKIGSLGKGSKVGIVESKDGWYKIKYNNSFGYVSSSYINCDNNQPPTTVPPTNNIKTGVVTASSLNVRSGYGTTFSKIGTLSKNTKVEIVESKNGWHKIKFKSAYGYVSGTYIK